LLVVFYENLFVQPRTEMGRIFRHIGRKPTAPLLEKALTAYARPSRMATAQSTLFQSAQAPLTACKNTLSRKQIDEGLRILDAFGVEALYSGDGVPNASALPALRPVHPTGAQVDGDVAHPVAMRVDRALRGDILH
jgi:hypothetical protein